MRENRRVRMRKANPRQPILPRNRSPRQPIHACLHRLILPLVFLGVLAGAGPAAARPAGAGVRPFVEGEGKPTINKPANQVSVLGATVNFKGSGSEMVTVKASGLPEGLTAARASLTEWTVTGKPTKITAPTTVKVTAENALKEAAVTTFEWTVDGINNPGSKTAIVGATVEIPVTGVGLNELTVAKALPLGLSLSKVSETEWKITGKPTTPGEVKVEFQGKNAAKEALPAVEFAFTVDGLNNPGAKTAIVGTAVSVPLTGVGLNALTATKALPEGLTLSKVSETEWKITGTPAKPQVLEVELKAENSSKEAFPTAKFTFTVDGLNNPGAKTAIAGTPVEIPVTGVGLNALTATKALPEGLTLSKVSETEWKITGTPAKPQVLEVELKAENSSKEAFPTAKFTFTVDGLGNPGAKTAIAGTPVEIPVTGVGLNALTATKALPEGLTLSKVSETEWKIVGTPAKPQVLEVELKGENSSKEAFPTAKFTFTVDGINNPGPQTRVVGAAVEIPVTGVGLGELKAAKALPEGLSLKKESETKWKIVGTPAKPQALEVELAGANAAKEALQPVKFTFTVDGINNPGPQTRVVGAAVEIPVTGVGLAELTAAKALPKP